MALPDELHLGTHAGVNLDLILKAEQFGKTYYVVDVNNNGVHDGSSGGNPDRMNHVLLDDLFNDGADTVITQDGDHDGTDDARSVHIESDGRTYAVILPTIAEIKALTLPTGWRDSFFYWSANAGTLADTHITSGPSRTQIQEKVDTTRRDVAVQVIDITPAYPDVIDLGIQNGVNLNLINKTELGGKTYYYVDIDEDGLVPATQTDTISGNQLDALFNPGNHTTATQEGNHNGIDDARSITIGDYAVVLPTFAEYQAIEAEFRASSLLATSPTDYYWVADYPIFSNHAYAFFQQDGTLSRFVQTHGGVVKLVVQVINLTDTIPPVTPTPPTAVVSVSDTTLTFGETAVITYTFSEEVTGFTVADIVYQGLGGSASNPVTDDNRIFTVMFTPSPNTVAIGTVRVRLTGVQDVEGTPGVGFSNVVTINIDTTELDTTSPVIALQGANPQIIELGAGYDELGATTDDGSEILIDSSAFVDAIGDYVIRYDATDSAGNIATTRTRAVHVRDTVAPVINVTGTAPIQVERGLPYVDAGATATDGTLVIATGAVNVNIVGDYNINYTATDASGNVGTASRLVQVRDTLGPIITLRGDDPQTLAEGAGYTELGAFTDDGSVVDIDASAFMDIVGSYTVIYTATDIYGNDATVVTRIVTVFSFYDVAPRRVLPTEIKDILSNQHTRPLQVSSDTVSR